MKNAVRLLVASCMGFSAACGGAVDCEMSYAYTQGDLATCNTEKMLGLTASECDDATQYPCYVVETTDPDVVDCAKVVTCPTDRLLASCDFSMWTHVVGDFEVTQSWYEGDGEDATCAYTEGICDALGGTFTCYSE